MWTRNRRRRWYQAQATAIQAVDRGRTRFSYCTPRIWASINAASEGSLREDIVRKKANCFWLGVDRMPWRNTLSSLLTQSCFEFSIKASAISHDIFENTGELGYDGPLYNGLLSMTDNMLGSSPMHIKYVSYVYDRLCMRWTNFPGPVESVISKFTCIFGIKHRMFDFFQWNMSAVVFWLKNLFQIFSSTCIFSLSPNKRGTLGALQAWMG